jgi:2-dehydro-3-deoxygluconokinase
MNGGARRLLAVGETMAMLTPAVAEPVELAERFRLDAGGAESNVAAHVAALGHRSCWFSRVGDDALGRRILRQLAERGVDVTGVVLDTAFPTGLYVKDPGNGVLYYRAGSAAARLTPDDADRLVLDGVAILHLSGITAAISPSAHEFLGRLMRRARHEGIRISFDVNHRAPLWTAAAAGPVLLDLARRADVVFVGRDEAELLWGTATPLDVRSLLPDVAELVVKDGEVGATAFTAAGEEFCPSLRVEVVDVVGAGDAFAGGYLASHLAALPVGERLAAGHRRAALTIATMGDSVEAPVVGTRA